jgi:hypothetical protein
MPRTVGRSPHEPRAHSLVFGSWMVTIFYKMSWSTQPMLRSSNEWAQVDPHIRLITPQLPSTPQQWCRCSARNWTIEPPELRAAVLAGELQHRIHWYESRKRMAPLLITRYNQRRWNMIGLRYLGTPTMLFSGICRLVRLSRPLHQ